MQIGKKFKKQVYVFFILKLSFVLICYNVTVDEWSERVPNGYPARFCGVSYLEPQLVAAVQNVIVYKYLRIYHRARH